MFTAFLGATVPAWTLVAAVCMSIVVSVAMSARLIRRTVRATLDEPIKLAGPLVTQREMAQHLASEAARR